MPVMSCARDHGSERLEAALAYAAGALSVFPVHGSDALGACSCGRRDCSSSGKHPRTVHGHLDATTDSEQIRTWWTTWPKANIAMNCGVSGRVVVDVDDKDGRPGPDNWFALTQELGAAVEETAIVATPSGGFHLHYLAGGQRIGSKNDLLGAGVDVKAEGGYVLLPPSMNAGIEYTWVEGHGIEKVAAIPEALAKRIEYVATASSRIRRAETGSADARISAGRRNETLTSLAGVMRRGGMSEAAIEAALQRENAAKCEPPLPRAEVRAIATSVSRYPAPAAADARSSRGTDSDNAERFIAMFGEGVRYSALEKSWYVYDKRRWTRDERLVVEEYMRQALLSVFSQAARSATDAEATSLGKSALRLQSAHARRSALECARSDPRIALHPTDFDRHPWLLNCNNGTLDLRSGELRAHDPGDLIRQLAPVAYDAYAVHETWERFLNEATAGDGDLQAYLQRAAGYTLTGDTGERVFFLLLGPTTTGKSTFVEAFVATLGDYAHPTGIEAFLRRTSVGGARPEIAALVGRRLVTGVEVDAKRHLDEVLIKQIVGGDTVSERDLYTGVAPFVPQCTLWFAANEAPQMSDTDDALWVRARDIPFTQQVPEERKDPLVKATLKDPSLAGPAILAWAVRGCREWQRHGLGSAQVVRRATQELRLSMDPLSDFLAECCCLESEAFASNRELRFAYRDWLAQWGRVDRMGPKEWGQRLRARGLEPDKAGGERGYRGIRLREAAAAASARPATRGQKGR